mmetsp:Transcript_16104/g.38254  ORF Transcript_16104/g.38254 Transcript_16104/m.38254 type:complete len:202 (+) Transcript_16104:2-607(+)
MGRLAEVLGSCKALARLDLGWNGIGREGAGRLSWVLEECQGLAHLSLFFNKIDDEGAERLSWVLGECKVLVDLDLRHNFIGPEGADRLVTALCGQKYEKWVNLYLTFNPLSRHGHGIAVINSDGERTGIEEEVAEEETGSLRVRGMEWEGLELWGKKAQEERLRLRGARRRRGEKGRMGKERKEGCGPGRGRTGRATRKQA